MGVFATSLIGPSIKEWLHHDNTRELLILATTDCLCRMLLAVSRRVFAVGGSFKFSSSRAGSFYGVHFRNDKPQRKLLRVGLPVRESTASKSQFLSPTVCRRPCRQAARGTSTVENADLREWTDPPKMRRMKCKQRQKTKNLMKTTTLN